MKHPAQQHGIISKTLFVIFLLLHFWQGGLAQTPACDVVQILHDPDWPAIYSPDSSKYFINELDSTGVYQIYAADAGDPNPTCISCTYTTGNCCGLFRHWATRQKMQVQWHPSGDFIICVVEKELYPELFYVPYELRLGWLQSGIWMDIWAVTPDGSHWYQLATTIRGVTGPAFTPDGSLCVWAEAQDSSNLFEDIFGLWKLNQTEFSINQGIPSFSNTTDITPAGAHWVEPGNFAPDGHRVLLSADIGLSNAEEQDQYILDIQDGSVINLTNSAKVWDEHGVFSPDGNKILFMSSYPYREDTTSYHTLSIKTEFMLMNADGSDLQQLTHYRDTGYYESGAGIAAVGFWSRDGSTIYGQTLTFPYVDNWILNFAGNCGNTTVATTEAQSNDGIWIYPNPTQGDLIVEAGWELKDARITVYNMMGQAVLQSLTGTNGEQVTLSTSNLRAGVYALRLQLAGRIFSRLFVKKED